MKKIYLSLLISNLCFAQTLGFEEILEKSLQNSKDLQKQEINIQISQENSKELNYANFGKLSLNSEISRTNHAGYVFMGKLSSREATFDDFGAGDFMENQYPNSLNIEPKNLNYPNARTNINTKLAYDIPLFMGFSMQNQADILNLLEKANKTLYTLDKKNLEFEVLQAYNGAVLAKDFVQTMKKAQEQMSFIEKGAIEFHKNGLVTKIDVNEAKVYMLNINSKLIEAQNNFDLALAYLKYLSGDENISDVEEFYNIYFDLNSLKNSENSLLYNQALNKRDEMTLQNIAIKANQKNIDVEKAAYYPQAFAHLEYGVNDNSFTLNSDKDYYTAVLGLSIAIFDGTRSTKVEKARLEELKSKLDLEKLKDGIKLELEKALLTYKSKQALLKEKLEAKELAFEVLEQAKLQYKNRLISMTTLLNQETNYRQSQTLLLNAKYENSLALAKLNLVLGQSLEENINNKDN
ncbi:TolC family protein [Arcobacter vandammei]|uniref:TolC family protein n=1 Tax=Arcobacter vandammei TaxID=2782243 RepID=UPI0018E02C2D|nr:TolC family protein [Arcobacter vandammei]